MSKLDLLNYKNSSRYIGLDLRDMEDNNFTKLIWWYGDCMNDTSIIKVVKFNQLIYAGFWL